MDSNFTYYIIVLLAIVVGIVIVKKVTSCLFRIISLLIVIGILAFLYFTYFR
jgi:ABC-type transport system involved in cytochrome c biogenesis permease subunit